MAQWRFSLDAVVVDNPVGWDKAKIIIERDRIIKGLFVTYTSVIEWHGTAYDTLIAKVNSGDICDVIDVLIEKRCTADDDFTTFFTGIMQISDIEVFESKCMIRTKIENASQSAKLLRLKEAIVPISGGFTINGAVLVDIGQNTDIETGVPASNAHKTTYNLFDAFSYILDYLFDSNVNFISDFYQNQRRNQETWQIIYTNDFVAGDIVRVTWRDFYEETHIIDTPFNANHAQTMADIIDNILLQFPAVGLPATQGDVATAWDNRYWINTALVGPRTIETEGYIPFTVVSSVVIGAPNPVTVTKTRPYFTGGKENVLVSGAHLADGTNLAAPAITQANAPIMTFQDLFVNLDKIHDISFSMVDVAGVPTVTIEPTEFFFENALALTFDNVPNLKFKIFPDYFRSQILLGDKSGKEEGAGVWKQETYLNGCMEGVIDYKNEYIIDAIVIEGTMGGTITDFDQDDIFIIQTSPNIFMGNEWFETFNLSVAGRFNFFDLTTMLRTIVLFLNIELTNAQKVRNHFFTLGADRIIQQNKAIVNDRATEIDKVYDFEFPLADSEILGLMANAFEFINFSATNQDHIRGWISRVEYSINTSKAKFKLFTE